MKKHLFSLFFALFFSLMLISCNKTEDNSVHSNNYINNDNTNKTDNIDKNEKDKNKIPKDNNDKSKPTKPPLSNSDKDNASTTHGKYRLFYFDSEKLQLYYVDKEIAVEDKAIIKALTKELQSNLPKSSFLALTDKVQIKSAKLDSKTGVLKVVFSDSYVNKMNLGSATESGLLSSLICTYGYNLGVDKVAIYFGDELYTSLKGSLPEGYFKVDYSSAIPYSLTSSNSETNEVKTMNCRIYYYNGADDFFYYKDKSINVNNGALVTALTNEMKNIPNEELFNFKDYLAVRSAKLDKANGVLTVDLSSSYYNILKHVGSGSEASALKTLALTYSYNYKVNKVIILVNGKPYEGSHIIMEPNEYININVTNIKPL